MNLINKIKEDIKNAMRNKDKESLTTLRMLLAKIENEKISMKLADISDLTDSQVESVVSSAIKEINKEIESYVAVGRETDSQKTEIELLLAYLPKQLTEDEVLKEVTSAVQAMKSSGGNIGSLMKFLSNELKGRADMKLVSKLAREEFGK